MATLYKQLHSRNLYFVVSLWLHYVNLISKWTPVLSFPLSLLLCLASQNCFQIVCVIVYNNHSRAVKPMYCALCDISMKFCTQVMYTIISFWFGYRTAMDLSCPKQVAIFLIEKWSWKVSNWRSHFKKYSEIWIFWLVEVVHLKPKCDLWHARTLKLNKVWT